MTPEQFLGQEPASALHGVLQLPDGDPQGLSHTGDRESLFFGEFEEIASIGTHETLPLADNSKRSWILIHPSVQESIITKHKSSAQEFTYPYFLTYLAFLIPAL